MLECVANVSEGRRDAVIDELAARAGRALLDVHRDRDHHRSVFTIAGTTHETLTAVRRLAEGVAATIDLSIHDGVHPRLGALDVVPFVAMGDTPPRNAVLAARAFAIWWSSVCAVPCFFYGAVDERLRDLPSLRRDAFTRRVPDTGPRHAHPRLGATAVGARPPLVALNCVLDGDASLADAQAIAASVRERDGGLPGVRALGFWLASRERAQVSMNLVDLQRTGLDAACNRVEVLAAERGRAVTEIELVGLIPASELDRCGPDRQVAARLDRRRTIEGRYPGADRPS